MALQLGARIKSSALEGELFVGSGLGTPVNHEITVSSTEKDMYWEVCFLWIQGIFLLLYKALESSPITGKDRTIVLCKRKLKDRDIYLQKG